MLRSDQEVVGATPTGGLFYYLGVYMTEEESSYEKFREKYDLPSYEELNWEYEIGDIEEDELVIRNIRKKVTEKIEHTANILSGIIQPDTEISSLHEISFFTEEEKQDVIKLYKKLMYYYRWASVLNVDDTEELNAKYIKDANEKLKEMKPKLLKIFEKLKESWTKDLTKTVDAAYFG